MAPRIQRPAEMLEPAHFLLEPVMQKAGMTALNNATDGKKLHPRLPELQPSPWKATSIVEGRCWDYEWRSCNRSTVVLLPAASWVPGGVGSAATSRRVPMRGNCVLLQSVVFCWDQHCQMLEPALTMEAIFVRCGMLFFLE